MRRAASGWLQSGVCQSSHSKQSQLSPILPPSQCVCGLGKGTVHQHSNDLATNPRELADALLHSHTRKTIRTDAENKKHHKNMRREGGRKLNKQRMQDGALVTLAAAVLGATSRRQLFSPLLSSQRPYCHAQAWDHRRFCECVSQHQHQERYRREPLSRGWAPLFFSSSWRGAFVTLPASSSRSVRSMWRRCRQTAPAPRDCSGNGSRSTQESPKPHPRKLELEAKGTVHAGGGSHRWQWPWGNGSAGSVQLRNPQSLSSKERLRERGTTAGPSESQAPS